MKTPDCNTCGGAECRQGRDCPRRHPIDVYVVRAIALYLVCCWLAIVGAALTLWPNF